MYRPPVVTMWVATLAWLGGVVACGDNLGASVDAATSDGRRIDAALADATTDDADLDAATDGADLDGATDDATTDDATTDDATTDDATTDDATTDDATTDDATTDGPTGPIGLRIASANLTSGNLQAYEGPGIRMLAGLDPDIALIQEMSYATSSAADLRSFVDQAFDPSFGYYREPGVQLPNGIVSRFPILAAGTWDDPLVANRGFAWARIDIPGPVDLWAVSVHLLTSSAGNRNSEAVALVAFVNANVPAADYLVIGGDFNTPDRGEPCVATLGAVVDIAPPHPADQNGNEFTNASRTKPYDWLLPDAELTPLRATTVLATSTYPTGLVLDTRVYTPLTDVAPALVTDSAAVAMQHMAVVKDFVLP